MRRRKHKKSFALVCGVGRTTLNHIQHNLLTVWSRVLLEKLIGFQLVKKCPAFYGTLRFITAVTSALHLSLYTASSIPLFAALFVQEYQSSSEAYSLTVSWQDMFLRWGVVSTSPNPKAGGPPLVCCPDCLFNLFVATFNSGGRSSIRNLRMRHAVVTGTHLSYNIMLTKFKTTYLKWKLLMVI